MNNQVAWYILLALISAGVLYWLFSRWRRRRRLTQIAAFPFPETWRNILARNLPWYTQLPDALKTRLENDIKWFLADKYFDGRNGLEITDEVRITIAGQACLLLLGRKKHRCFPKLDHIVVYPDAYVATTTEAAGGVAVRRQQTRLGESWQDGAVVLSWRHVLAGAKTTDDGHNVVIHEFAHRLDQLSGRADGTPLLEDTNQYRRWARVMGREFSALRRQLRKRRKTWLDAYGATNEAEFFAVLTEYFFEKPHALKKYDAELFGILKDFYGLDPERLKATQT